MFPLFLHPPGRRGGVGNLGGAICGMVRGGSFSCTRDNRGHIAAQMNCHETRTWHGIMKGLKDRPDNVPTDFTQSISRRAASSIHMNDAKNNSQRGGQGTRLHSLVLYIHPCRPQSAARRSYGRTHGGHGCRGELTCVGYGDYIQCSRDTGKEMRYGDLGVFGRDLSREKLPLALGTQIITSDGLNVHGKRPS